MPRFIREKKIYCGKHYMEVDIFPYTTEQKKAAKGKRSKRKKESAPKQRNLNDKNSRRYFTQLANSNFTEADDHVTLTYNQQYLPATFEEAQKDARNALRRIAYRRKKEGLEPLKYILVTECTTKKNSDQPVRIHHHIIMNGGLDRKTIKDCWRKRKKKGQKEGDKIGRVHVDELEPDENGLTGLCKYLTKNPGGKKRWSASQNLEKPVSQPSNSTYRSRKKLEEAARTMDKAYFEKNYPGWYITSDYGFRTEYNEDIAEWYIYLQLRKRE